ncbi:hypothetical protein Pint_04019 [Pistacia integerrima]|uniref:Uncharacterized protein n=1 Tax=Pistacia integerrima TaxID=434235 RepID=A0ACC0Z9K5_9ROSI|nr:hypothetical protein Pint_04019 [Pistacia integerrima]
MCTFDLSSIQTYVQPRFELSLGLSLNHNSMSLTLLSHRWNLIVTSILRTTVYSPLCWAFIHLIGRMWSPLPFVIKAFLVSGGDVVFPSYMACVHDIEVAVKLVLTDKWRLHPVVSGPLVVVFVSVTSV